MPDDVVEVECDLDSRPNRPHNTDVDDSLDRWFHENSCPVTMLGLCCDAFEALVGFTVEYSGIFDDDMRSWTVREVW